jgi:hypothetical protein
MGNPFMFPVTNLKPAPAPDVGGWFLQAEGRFQTSCICFVLACVLFSVHMKFLRWLKKHLWDDVFGSAGKSRDW